MKKYKSREVVLAEQYTGQLIDGIKIGKNDPTNRWDDTPDGPYIVGERFKYRVKEGDWIIKREDSKYLSVLPDAEFNKRYKLKTNQ